MAAPQFPELPGHNVGVDLGQSAVEPNWYLFFKRFVAAVKFAYDFANNYVPPGHDDTKSDVIRSINSQTGTSYTFELTDSGKICEFANASAVTVTVPPNLSVAFPVGTQIEVVQSGAGKVTLAQGSGVTIKSVGSQKSLAAQDAGATLYKRDTDVWWLGGTIAS